MPNALSAKELRRAFDPARFSFKTTKELKPLEEIVGQDRAVAAIRFGIGIEKKGYNLFAMGPQQTGKYQVIRQFLEQAAQKEATPNDWCYVNNFADDKKPEALELPAGKAVTLRDRMSAFIEELKVAIPAAFESDDYRTRRKAIEEHFKEEHEKVFRGVQEAAREREIALIRTPMGLGLAPMKDGEVLNPEQFGKLPEEERERIENEMQELQEPLQEAFARVPQLEKEEREQIRQLNREVTTLAVSHLIKEISRDYEALPEVIAHLDAVRDDVVENAATFVLSSGQGGEGQGGMPGMPGGPMVDPAFFHRYEVNVLVDHSKTEGAPVVFEDHPTLANLIGRIEHQAQFGALITDFTLIRPGALHQANGGYLILDARKLLTQPFSWESLKRALNAGCIRIESAGEMLSLVSTVSIEPERIPLNLKIVLLGEPMIYYLLSSYDAEFSKLFKVVADFDDRLDNTEDNHETYARLLVTLIERNELKPFDAGAVARVFDESIRMTGDTEKLTTFTEELSDLLREADHWAGEAGRESVTAEDVTRAVEEEIFRVGRIRDRMQEQIVRETLLIDTSGSVVGQINGLAVYQLGQFSFGKPNRITASVRMGRGGIVDIEREAKLGGNIHSKGVLILTGYLNSKYVPDHPITLSASIVFEQSYGGVDGDSASTAETCALISALAGIPINQELAITGSLNQQGHVQAIGGVNEKIEGFFDICEARGLTGKQGVIIPESNVKHLMLRPDVVEAAEQGKFHIYPVSTADEALEILTGKDAGQRSKSGKFPRGSINYAVEKTLEKFSERARDFNRPEKVGAKAAGKKAGKKSKHESAGEESAQ
ncbi:MAG: AAA family ATPase [Chrysiogenetes bacterium]|nr:AAA family ATPase [Chrysiogenetes bacterium]